MSAPVPKILNCWNKRQKKCLFKTFDTFFIDCERCLWHDNEVVPGAIDFINSLKSMNKSIYYVTDNSLKTRNELWLKAKRLQFNIEENEILAPTHSIANYLKQHLGPDESVYVIGTWALAKELIDLKIPNFGVGPDPYHCKLGYELSNILTATKSQKVGAVVVGFDPHFSVNKIIKSSNFLENNEKSLFLATSADGMTTFHQYCIPGTGSILIAIETFVGRKAIVMGMPNPLICQHLVENGTVNPEKTLMIGECIKLDIFFGKECGFKTMLVGTGCNDWQDVEVLIKRELKDYMPDYYINRLGDLGPDYEI